MKQIEKDLCAAVAAHRDFKQANTEYRAERGEVILHGHVIARRVGARFEFNLCGWNTPTTRSRLNALGAGVASKAGIPHVYGRAVPLNGWFAGHRVEVAA